VREVAIGPNDAGQRLDRFLRKLLPSATLGHVFKLLRKGNVKLNGRKSKPDVRLTEGDKVTLFLSPERMGDLATGRARQAAPRNRSRKALTFLYRDDHVLAVDKPPFLVVQPGGDPTEATLEDLVRESIGPVEGLTFRPSLAHRLDRGTSGVILMGISAPGLRGLTQAFREQTVTKTYLALVEGVPREPQFTVDAPLLRASAGEGQAARVRVSHHPDALAARTEVSLLAASPDGRYSLVQARPKSGRTHQIRVHLRSKNLPIVGDGAYGRPQVNRLVKDGAGLWRTFLHAARIQLRHPVEPEQRLDVRSPLPDDLLRALKWAKVPRAAVSSSEGDS